MLSRLLVSTLLILPGPAPAPEADLLAQAREQVEDKSWTAAQALLVELLEVEPNNPLVHELMGDVQVGLDDPDAAAHRFDMALRMYTDASDRAGIKRATRSLKRADPLEARRSKLRRSGTTRLYKAAKTLFELGNTARALEFAEAMMPFAEGKDTAKLRTLLEKIQATSEEVDLDEQTQELEEGASWPLITFESEHYILQANLEEEVVSLVADTMDDIHGYYVKLYLDGDEGAVSGAKAIIRVHPTKASMLENWSGASTVEGWWSPGENKVTCYDTRTTTGSLEWMLETLFHEASHQFMTQLERKGGSAPAWLNEGTASFFEGATAMADRRVLWPDAALKRLNSLVAMLGGSGAGPSFNDVIGYDQPGSYPGAYYAWGWGIVFFMQQYEDPESLEYVFRPRYAEYRERITSRGGGSRELFQEVFLNAGSPLGHETLADFEATWRAWILDQVAPLHRGSLKDRRVRRLALVERYKQAAESARDNRKAPVPSLELLTRALGHIEYIRKQIDGEENDNDVDLIRLQSRILVELERPLAAAPLVERLLELADAGEWTPSEEEYAALEKELQKLDRSNYALRRAVSTRKSLARSARTLFESYMKDAEDPQSGLRALTFASRFGLALGDTEVLLPAANKLREELRESGRLIGTLQRLQAPGRNWNTIYSEDAQGSSLNSDPLTLTSVRPNGMINTKLLLGDEYELRGTFVRDGEMYRSTTHGFVIAATEEGDWLVFGLQKSGGAGLWYLKTRPGGGVNTRKVKTVRLDVVLEDGEEARVSIHVRNEEWIRIRVGNSEVVEIAYPEEMRRGKHVGIYAKDGTTKIRNAVVETY